MELSKELQRQELAQAQKQVVIEENSTEDEQWYMVRKLGTLLVRLGHWLERVGYEQVPSTQTE